jgi:hypothetical protein
VNRIPRRARPVGALGLVVVGLPLLLAAPLPARADTGGFCLGLQLHSSQLGTVDDAAGGVPSSVYIEENGGGLGLWAGWGINESFTLRLDAAVAGHPTSDEQIEVATAGFTLEALYLFRHPDAFRPFLLGGVGVFGVASRDDEYDYSTTGPGILAGGGFYYFLGSTFAFELSGRGEFVNWREEVARRQGSGSEEIVDTPIEQEGVAGKLTLGLALFF